MLPHWLFLPVFVSSNLQYNEAENVDVPLPIFYAQAPFRANNFLKKKSNQEKNTFQALVIADPLYSFSQLAPREHLVEEEPVHRGWVPCQTLLTYRVSQKNVLIEQNHNQN